jgi:hypothetical protein
MKVGISLTADTNNGGKCINVDLGEHRIARISPEGVMFLTNQLYLNTDELDQIMFVNHNFDLFYNNLPK